MTANAELRIACGLLAALALMTSQILFDPPHTLVPFFDAVTDNQQNWLGWFMLIHAVVLWVSLILKCRPLRQWGLVIGCISWIALAMSLLNSWATLKSVALVIIVGLFYLAVLTCDVQRNTRWNR